MASLALFGFIFMIDIPFDQCAETVSGKVLTVNTEVVKLLSCLPNIRARILYAYISKVCAL